MGKPVGDRLGDADGAAVGSSVGSPVDVGLQVGLGVGSGVVNVVVVVVVTLRYTAKPDDLLRLWQAFLKKHVGVEELTMKQLHSGWASHSALHSETSL